MFLEEIVAEKRHELAARQASLSLIELKRRIVEQAEPLDFTGALVRDREVSLIAEVKKASPSKGLLLPSFDAVALAKTYAENGASAISVLTEERHFQGSLEHLSAIRRALGNGLPLLRKDFIFDPYQVYEARAYGADALLLIVAILGDEELRELLVLSRQLGMQCLVEAHDQLELERALKARARVIGINNRDLRTFKVDLTTTQKLAPLVPNGNVIVSESGIRSRQDMDLLRAWGVQSALVGEALVTARDIPAKVRELV
ncbi:MAG: indole-3-glycerol phosphate synthase TrpC [Chloroflexota bacterium]